MICGKFTKNVKVCFIFTQGVYMDIHETILKMTDEQKVKLLGGKDNWNTAFFDEYKIPSVKTSDGPQGLRVEVSNKKLGFNESKAATCFPSSAALSSTWNVDLVKEVGVAIGEEAAYNGVNVVLSPGINIKRNPLCGRNFEYFSEDPYLSGQLGAAMIEGIQKNGTGACVKHFAANNREYRRMTVNSVIDERALREIYLTPFEIAVKKASPKMVMTAYNKVNGTFANENEHLIGDILRKKWQFDGVVTSDWGGTHDRVRSVNAGSDLCMPRSNYYEEVLLEGVKKGEVDKEKLDKSVYRMIRLANETNKPYKAGASGIEYMYNRQVALKAAEEALVLLKNDNVLPLNHFEPIVFVRNATTQAPIGGGGSSRVVPLERQKIDDIVLLYDLNVESVRDFTYFTEDKKKKPTNVLPCTAEVAIVIFSNPDYYETEGRDRPNFELCKEQISAYRSIREQFKKVISVVVSGSAVNLSPILNSDAILYCPLLGETQEKAIMNVLCGEANPCGKLSESFPSSYNDVPTNLGDDFTCEYRESIYVGYRYYEKANVPVLFPFGHGLSYTEFLYSNASADKKGVKFDIKNIGDTDGAEICQIYLSKPESKVYRPVKELKGFVKVFLRAGEQKSIYVPFDEYTFRYYNTKTSSFEKEAGVYKIYVAASSEDIRLSVNVLNSGTGKILQDDDIPTYYTGKISNVSKEEFERLLGYKLENRKYNFYKKNRIKITLDETIKDLAYSKGLISRAVGKYFKNKTAKASKLSAKKAADLCMASDIPLRTAVTYAGFSVVQAEGLVDLCNGKFFTGVKKMLTKKKKQS